MHENEIYNTQCSPLMDAMLPRCTMTVNPCELGGPNPASLLAGKSSQNDNRQLCRARHRQKVRAGGIPVIPLYYLG